MKKFAALFLIAVCLVSSFSVAEGKLKATQKILCATPGEDSAYFFAKIENVGDEPVGTGSGSLATFTEDDEILFTTSYISTLPSGIVLQPGEYVYMRDFIWETALAENTVADYKFSIDVDNYPNEVERVPSEVTYSIEGAKGYDNYVYVTFTNPTEEAIYGFYVSAALLDAEGCVIFAEGTSLNSLAVHPGSTITVKLYVDADVLTYYAANGIEIASADSIVFYGKE